MKKVLVVVGPTGVGKTALSIELAHRLNAEIISGDSIQVFQGMDIGSGKINAQEMDGIPHHGLDFLSPKEKMTVAEFQKRARKLIDEIHQRGKLPMIVGGTGLYIKACLYDYEFEEQEEIDPSLLQKYESMKNGELWEYLKSFDEDQALKIHENNRQRLLRACLIYDLHQVSKSDQINKQEHKLLYDAYILGCTMERESLYHQINQRVVKMMEEGLEGELKKLLSQGVTFEDHGMQGIGYREWKEYFEGKRTVEEVQSLIQKNSRQFARRQYTWFRNQMETHWVDLSNPEEKQEEMQRIEGWYRNE